MTKDDYIAWRNDPVTEEYLEQVLIECDSLTADLVNSAGRDSLVDRYRCGIIQGLKSLAEWVPQFDRPEKEIDEDES